MFALTSQDFKENGIQQREADKEKARTTDGAGGGGD